MSIDDFNALIDALILKLRNNKKLDDSDIVFLINILQLEKR